MKTEKIEYKDLIKHYRYQIKNDDVVTYHGLFFTYRFDYKSIGYFYQYNKKGFNLRNDL